MTDQADLTAFERAMRIKLGLIKPYPKPEPVKPERTARPRTPAKKPRQPHLIPTLQLPSAFAMAPVLPPV